MLGYRLMERGPGEGSEHGTCKDSFMVHGLKLEPWTSSGAGQGQKRPAAQGEAREGSTQHTGTVPPPLLLLSFSHLMF